MSAKLRVCHQFNVIAKNPMNDKTSASDLVRDIPKSNCDRYILLLHLHLYPTSMWGRCGTRVASVQLGRTPLPTVPSLSDNSDSYMVVDFSCCFMLQNFSKASYFVDDDDGIRLI